MDGWIERASRKQRNKSEKKKDDGFGSGPRTRTVHVQFLYSRIACFALLYINDFSLPHHQPKAYDLLHSNCCALFYSPIVFKGVFRYRIRMRVVGVGWVRHSSSYSCRCHNTSIGVVVNVIIIVHIVVVVVFI